jgi:hypothetical protein
MLPALLLLAAGAVLAAPHGHHAAAPTFPGYIVTGKITGHSAGSPQWGYDIARQTTSSVGLGLFLPLVGRTPPKPPF